MNYRLFRQEMFDLVCFTNHQILAWQPNFNRNNLTRWIHQGLLVRLRQGLYTFPEYNTVDYIYYFANRMYKPSYISLHTALSFYGMIPEGGVELTSVTTLKTNSFTNSLGDFSYKKVKNNIFFGYDRKSFKKDRTILFAKPEKALLDLLYLYPFYNTSKELSELRLDEYFISEELDVELFMKFANLYKSKALNKRANLLLSTYDI